MARGTTHPVTDSDPPRLQDQRLRKKAEVLLQVLSSKNDREGATGIDDTNAEAESDLDAPAPRAGARQCAEVASSSLLPN
jgi:hypothetical protein